jgi:hypothetical protein
MGKAELLRGLDLLASGDWSGAHAIAQADPTALGSWLHGIVHIIEGDQGNAQYWYRRADRTFPGMQATEPEIQALRSTLLGGAAP